MILNLQERLDYTISQIANKETGCIRLTTTSTRGYYILPKILPLFKKKYPGYHIEIKERNVLDIEQTLRDGAADLAIYSLPNRNPDFQYHHINTEEVVLCLAQDSPLIKYAEMKEGFRHPWLDLKYLENETFFINDPLHWQIGKIGQQLMKEAHIHPEITELRNLETCLALASSGLGVTFSFDICETCFHNHTAPPAYLSVGKEPYTGEFVLGCRKGYVLSSEEQDFLSLLREEFS